MHISPEMISLFMTLGLGGMITSAIYFLYGLA